MLPESQYTKEQMIRIALFVWRQLMHTFICEGACSECSMDIEDELGSPRCLKSILAKLWNGDPVEDYVLSLIDPTNGTYGPTE